MFSCPLHNSIGWLDHLVMREQEGKLNRMGDLRSSPHQSTSIATIFTPFSLFKGFPAWLKTQWYFMTVVVVGLLLLSWDYRAAKTNWKYDMLLLNKQCTRLTCCLEMSFFNLSISLETASLSSFSLSVRSFSSVKRSSLSCKAVFPPWSTYLKKTKRYLTIPWAYIETSRRLRTNVCHKGVWDSASNQRELRLVDGCLGKPLINPNSRGIIKRKLPTS